MTPEVSVIIPAYNTSPYISRAINSALQQTLIAIEVIVVDDASTDETVEIINKFTDPRLVKVFNTQNLGAGGARNIALHAAKGNWVAVLDSDDWFAPERLEKLAQIVISKKADIIADDLYFIQDGEEEPWSTLIQESGIAINGTYLIDALNFVKTSVYGQQGLHLGLSKPLFRRDFLVEHQIKYDETVKVSQDFWFVMDCLKHGAKFYLVPEPHYFYRSRPGSLVGNNKIRHLSDDSRKISELLQDTKFMEENSELVAPLLNNLRIIEQNLSYYRIVEPIKRQQYFTAFKEIFLNPYFFISFASRLPGILRRRLQYYFYGNKLAFEMMYRSSKG